MGASSSRRSEKQAGAKVKLLLMGRARVGKSAIVNSYQGLSFNESYEPSIGCHLENLKVDYNGCSYQLLVMDALSDSDLTLSCRLKSIQNSEVLAIVFDLSDEETFNDIREKIRVIKENNYNNSRLMVIGNKCDLENRLGKSEIRELITSIDDYELEYLEVSAKTGEGVSKMFVKAMELGYFVSKARWDRIKVILFVLKYSLPAEATQFSWANLCEALPSLVKKKRRSCFSITLLPQEIIKKLIFYI